MPVLIKPNLKHSLGFFLASKAGITQQMVGSVGFVYCSWPKMKLGLSKKNSIKYRVSKQKGP